MSAVALQNVHENGGDGVHTVDAIECADLMPNMERVVMSAMSWEDCIQLMLDNSVTLPVESMWVESAQLLADTLVSIQSDIDNKEMAVLIGIGAMLVRQGKREMEAGSMASDLFAKLKRIDNAGD